MKAFNKRHSDVPSSSTPPAPLKGSDFFPPGAGWNRAKKPDENAPRYPADKYPGTLEKH